MFVKKKPLDQKGQLPQQEQIITRAMGVRIPPRRPEKESMAIEQEIVSMTKSPHEVALSPTLCIPVKKEFEDNHQSDGKPEVKALESIKITAPGTYELNLPSLFESEGLIMAVKEGTYFIDLTSVFKKGKKD
jgi:hypothetical protein